MAGEDTSILPWLRALIGSGAPPPTPGPPSSWPTAGATPPPPPEERYSPPEGEGYVPGAEQLPEAWAATKPYLQASPETREEFHRRYNPARFKPPPSATPQLRAATPIERVGDRLQDFYGGAAAHPLGKIADLLGVSDLEGMHRSFSEPPPEVSTAAQVPSGPIKIPRGGGTLARSYRRGSPRGLGANHPLSPNAAERVIRLHDMGADLPRQGDWRGMTPEYVASFGVGRDAEPRARQYLRTFAANTPATDVPTSSREAAAAHAWRLTHPGKELKTTASSPDLLHLPGEAITMAGAKVPNINRSWRDEPLGGLKVDAFGNFMLDELGPLGHPMARNQHPGLINWQHETPLIDLPWDRHAGWGVGDVPNDWMLDDEYKHLRQLMSPWEGLVHPGSYPPKPFAGNQGGLTNKDIYDRLSWGLGNTLVGHDPSAAMQPLFGRFWSGAQAQKKLLAGKRPVFDGGLLDIHRDVGLLEPGAMMDPDRIYRALEKKPWGNLGWGPGY